MTQAQVLIQAFNLIVKSNCCPDTPIRDWIKILLFTHKKGYLWVSVEDNRVAVVACAYRVPDLEPKTLERFPEKESGKILYVPWMASVAGDRMIPKRMLTQYLEKCPEVEEVAFYDWADQSKKEKLKIFKRHKEGKNGIEEQKSPTTSNAAV